MRVIDCDCGETLTAANDDDLIGEVRRHIAEAHAGDDELQMDDEEIHELVSSQAYSAMDS